MQNQLFQLEQFENGLSEKSFKNIRELKVEFGGDNLQMIYIRSGSKPVLCGKLDKALIYKIGKLLFKGENSWSVINFKWQHALLTERIQFGKQVAQVLADLDFKALSFEFDKKEIIYGIVSPRFLKVSQMRVRDELLLSLKRNSIKVLGSTQSLLKNGLVRETFLTPIKSKRIRYNYIVDYSRNNDYDNMEFGWDRTVIICTNGLERSNADYTIKFNTSEAVSISDFVEKSIVQGLKQRQITESNIDRANCIELNGDLYREFRRQLNLEATTKTRLEDILRREIKIIGKNEWALSQALTWTGTHQQSIADGQKRVFREVGTLILEDTLKEYLTKPVGKYEDDHSQGILHAVNMN